MAEQTLSKRGQNNVSAGQNLEKFVAILADLYDKDTNPNGMSVDHVLQTPAFAQRSKLTITSRHLTYGDGPFGSRVLRSALSSFFNDYFHPIQKVLPEHLLVAGGVTSCIDLITFAVADEGDGILIGRPLYTSFASDVKARAGAVLCPVSSEGKDPMGEEMVQQYEKELLRQEKAGVKIRGIILARSSVDALKAYMRLCQRHRIHLISDEIYAMSIYSTPSNASATPFTSVLAIDTTGLIDSNLVHVLYGASKDFSSNGLRLGVILSPSSPPLLQSIKSIAAFSWPSSVAETYWSHLLNDRPFLTYYFEENSSRLAAGYARVTDFLRERDVKWVEGSNAGFFLWADFRGVLGIDDDDNNVDMNNKQQQGEGNEEDVVETAAMQRPPSQIYKTSQKAQERDEWFFEKLQKEKVYIASGNSFFAEEHGWYRVSFSVPGEVLEVGLERLGRVLEGVRREGGVARGGV
ncbi:MAG: hypothetical protein Q9220_005685 [cf. Caloplaca sp. 1 TL-2023]